MIRMQAGNKALPLLAAANRGDVSGSSVPTCRGHSMQGTPVKGHCPCHWLQQVCVTRERVERANMSWFTTTHTHLCVRGGGLVGVDAHDHLIDLLLSGDQPGLHLAQLRLDVTTATTHIQHRAWVSTCEHKLWGLPIPSDEPLKHADTKDHAACLCTGSSRVAGSIGPTHDNAQQNTTECTVCT